MMYPKRSVQTIPFSNQYEIIDRLTPSDLKHSGSRTFQHDYYHNIHKNHEKYALATMAASAATATVKQTTPQTESVHYVASDIPQSMSPMTAPLNSTFQLQQLQNQLSSQALSTQPMTQTYLAPGQLQSSTPLQNMPYQYPTPPLSGRSNPSTNTLMPSPHTLYETDFNLSNHSLDVDYNNIWDNSLWNKDNRNIW